MIDSVVNVAAFARGLYAITSRNSILFAMV